MFIFQWITLFIVLLIPFILFTRLKRIHIWRKSARLIYLSLSIISSLAVVSHNWKFLSHLTTGCHTVPFDVVCNKNRTSKNILLIHGLASNAETWNDFTAIACQKQSKLNTFRVLSVDYETLLGEKGLSMVEVSQSIWNQLSVFIKNENNEKQSEVYIIGHSLGGVIGRKILLDYLKEYKKLNPFKHINLKGIISIGSPLSGSCSAKDWQKYINDIKYIKEISYDSKFMKGLRKDWKNVTLQNDQDVKHYCLLSIGDELIAKEEAAYGCDGILQFQKGWGHTKLHTPERLIDARFAYPALLLNAISRNEEPSVHFQTSKEYLLPKCLR